MLVCIKINQTDRKCLSNPTSLLNFFSMLACAGGVVTVLPVVGHSTRPLVTLKYAFN